MARGATSCGGDNPAELGRTAELARAPVPRIAARGTDQRSRCSRRLGKPVRAMSLPPGRRLRSEEVNPDSSDPAPQPSPGRSVRLRAQADGALSCLLSDGCARGCRIVPTERWPRPRLPLELQDEVLTGCWRLPSRGTRIAGKGEQVGSAERPGVSGPALPSARPGVVVRRRHSPAGADLASRRHTCARLSTLQKRRHRFRMSDGRSPARGGSAGAASCHDRAERSGQDIEVDPDRPVADVVSVERALHLQIAVAAG